MRIFVSAIRMVVLIGLTGSLGVSCAAAPAVTSVSMTPTHAVAATNAAVLHQAAIPSAATASTMAVEPGIPFEIVAQGAAFVGEGKASVKQALRGDDPHRAVPANLPADAQAALKVALAHSASALYIVISAGQQPSTGYSVRILSVTRRNETGVDQLVVNYTLDKPAASQGGAAVMTHPFVIARIADTDVHASDVTFVEQKSAP